MSTAKRLTPNKIANLVMADEAWHDSEYVAASDYDALSTELAALRAERDALRAAVEEIEERTRPNGDMADLDVNLVARAALGERMEGGQ